MSDKSHNFWLMSQVDNIYISGHLTHDFFTLIDFSRYVDDCTVSDATDANKKVDIIENQCFASVINAINESTNMLSTSDFK